ncbi:MAG: CotH kinase family protein [Clostridia bacterium]|nr:CotH kinase family protein [Clostridia bacterium]
MKKLELLAAMLALCALMAAAVVLGSPYAPAVGPYREIEALWEIEDEREESAQPLITALENHGVPLAFDRESNTFYCTLGLENGAEWPDVRLTAPGAKRGTAICFADDYTYDWCDEAIREGYAYQLMAYTDSEYAYFNLVFTGLPLVVLRTDEEIGTQDVSAQMIMSQWGEEAVRGSALAHIRGDGSLYNEKKSYKIKFVRGANRTGSAVYSVPGMGETDELILLAMAYDETLMRDRLSWEMAALAPTPSGAFAARKTQYAEVFVGDAYCGIYLMMEPYDIEEELRKEGAEAVLTDSLYRTFVPTMNKERPYLKTEDGAYELFYAPNEASAFDALETYLSLMDMEDEAFVREAESCIHLDSMLRYTLLVQAMALTDNSSNNMFIWARKENGRVRYRFELWDMDLSWDFDPGSEYDYWFALPVQDRALNLDVGGARGRMAELWAQMKANGFTAETVEALTQRYQHELVDSGAYMRNMTRWNLMGMDNAAFAIASCAQGRFEMLDLVTQALCEAEERMVFLDSQQRENGYAVAIGDWLAALRAAQDAENEDFSL